ncbi:hypothetical protein [Amycolatopsis sp. BJA-103]|uniref:hypothetical protein n=1 Tax=Amycolatopsis sp. BJA-103 TaxID=1911175 RepID=UPI000C78193B|nr:hypothetical protein [Amycolatopsis sp. BJA-103]AUI56773.1 hypothetical protein BKN51_00135 [Amycolatopsis sp. BJA-103]AUI64131.1 hypothetical protein BKN51_42280 [Amycolatopsis sp. BJA-103]PNE13085.1 hypothetical protein B1H26_42445 [Amycolatopsis sp. BJA-103]
MQFENDVDLARAIASPELVLEGLLEVDWNRNGLYNHKYADMSWLTTRVTIDDGPLSGGMPIEVNDVSGFASSQLDVTFGGVRYLDPDAQAAWSQQLAEQGLTAIEFFDRYNPRSPINGLTVEGTPIRYARLVATDSGEKKLQQFEGWIRTPVLDELAQTVTITAGDVEDLAGALLTLPRWAIGPGPSFGLEPNGNGDYSPLHPISVEWVIEECLRAGGRGTGPMPRPDAVGYWTVHGSWLPSIGHLGGVYPSKHTITYDSDFKSLKYGIGHNWASWNDNGRASGGEAWAASRVEIPWPGSGDPPGYIGMAGWFESNGAPTGPYFRESEMILVLDDSGVADPGHVRMIVANNGRTEVRFYENPGSGSPNAGLYRRWEWDSNTTGGWHYHAAHITVTSTSITVTLRIDDVVKAWTTTPSLTGGYREAQPPRPGASNKIVAQGRLTPCQHMQIYAGDSAATYDPNQKHPKWALEGKPVPSVRTTSKNLGLTWLPDVKNRNAWEVLKEIVAAELGTLHTDEFKRIHFQNAEVGYLPAYYGVDTAPKRTITRDEVQNVRVKPSSDQYRNAIAMSWTTTKQVRKIVWQNPDAQNYFLQAGSSLSATVSMSDIVGIYADVAYTNGTAAPADPHLYGTQLSACRADTVGTVAPSGWSASVVFADDQRSMDISILGTSAPIYAGSLLGGASPNFTVGGNAMDSKATTREILQSPPQIAMRGAALLDIPDNPWRQDASTTFALSYIALLQCVDPLPLLDSITITADPRLQLRDYVLVEAASATYYCQIIGIRRSDGPDGSLDTLTLRLAAKPGTWVLDDPVLSILDSTTVLA